MLRELILQKGAKHILCLPRQTAMSAQQRDGTQTRRGRLGGEAGRLLKNREYSKAKFTVFCFICLIIELLYGIVESFTLENTSKIIESNL